MALAGGRRTERGTNLGRVKDFNEVVVLDLVRAGGPIGRPAIAAATGLTLQTVSNIVGRLLAAGVVLEGSRDGPGRARRELRVNPDAAFALGIQLVRTRLAVGVVDLAGTIRGAADSGFAAGEAPAAVVERLEALVAQAVGKAGIDQDRLLGAGFGAPGPLDLRSGRTLNLLNPPAWSDFAWRRAVADVLGVRVIMDNDATAAALGEKWAGVAARAQSFIYVYLGTGLGAGLFLQGQAYRGVRGNAGEIAHMTAQPDGPPCECGRRGCLGLYLTPDGLLREARRVALEAPSNQPIDRPPATLAELVASRGERYLAVLDRAGALLAGAVREMSRVLDPELIALGGPLVPFVGSRFAAALTGSLRQLDESGAPPPRVAVSGLGSDAGVIGAATLVLHDLFAPTPHKLGLTGSPSDLAPGGRRPVAAPGLPRRRELEPAR